MPFGKVRFFDFTKGFGFVKLEDGREAYVHRSAIPGNGFRYLAAGERIDVDVEWNPARGQHAITAIRLPVDRSRGRVAEFDPDRGFGVILAEGGSPPIFVHNSHILAEAGQRRLLETGEEVEFSVIDGPRGPEAIDVKRLDPRPPLLRFASLGKGRRWLVELANLAEPEPWDYSSDNAPQYAILRNYVSNTFSQVEAERRIGYGGNLDGEFACFNTGLLDKRGEELFAMFDRNPQEAALGVPWRLLRYPSASDRQLRSTFPMLPSPPLYFDSPNQLVYDRRLPVHIDVPHILEERLDRLPQSLRENSFVAAEMLKRAADHAVARASRNHRIAIPHFYRGEIQLLLPLAMQSANRPDLALVLAAIGHQYRGETILTLEMAYSSARLLSRPSCDWVLPSRAG